MKRFFFGVVLAFSLSACGVTPYEEPSSGAASAIPTAAPVPLTDAPTGTSDRFCDLRMEVAEPLNCVHSRAYWLAQEAWTLSSAGLGNTCYPASQLREILAAEPGANGLAGLAQDVILAKLNIAAGAEPSGAGLALQQAFYLIGDLWVPPVGGDYLPIKKTGSYSSLLDRYNRGTGGSTRCAE